MLFPKNNFQKTKKDYLCGSAFATTITALLWSKEAMADERRNGPAAAG
jgi:hypothetical protein